MVSWGAGLSRRTGFEAQAKNVAWICQPRIRCVKRALMNDERWSALNRSWRAGRAPERSNGDTLRVVVPVRIHCPPAPRNSKRISGCRLASKARGVCRMRFTSPPAPIARCRFYDHFAGVCPDAGLCACQSVVMVSPVRPYAH